MIERKTAEYLRKKKEYMAIRRNQMSEDELDEYHEQQRELMTKKRKTLSTKEKQELAKKVL